MATPVSTLGALFQEFPELYASACALHEEIGEIQVATVPAGCGGVAGDLAVSAGEQFWILSADGSVAGPYPHAPAPSSEG
jgi:hypothetical protein